MKRNTIIQTASNTSGVCLGGIGTGGVELWPDGRFYHWNLVNSRPWAIASDAPQFHGIPPVQPAVGDADFLLRVQRPGQRPQFRWLFCGHGATIALGHFWRHHKYSFAKSFPRITYRAEFPFVRLTYEDPKFPVHVSLCAWSPLIPRDVKHSSLPGFFLDFTLRNRTGVPLDVSLCWMQQNLAGYAAPAVRQAHAGFERDGVVGVRMQGSLDAPEHDSSGCMSLWVQPRKGQRATRVAANPYLANLIWPLYASGSLDGPLSEGVSAREELDNPPRAAMPNKGWLCVQQKLPARSRTEFRCGLSWFFPHHRSTRGTRVGHMYENWFADSTDVAAYLCAHRDDLRRRSAILPELVLASKVPESLRLSLLDQLSTLVTNSHFIKDGRIGLQEGQGCCAFNTVDVDHYASYAMALLFPQLRAAIDDQQTSMAHPVTGRIHHGLEATVEAYDITADSRGYGRWDCTAQYILQIWRDARWAGDRGLLERSWPTVKRAAELLLQLDGYGVGLPYVEGGLTYDHWHTHGVVTYMAGVTLAAWRAAEEMARLMHDADTAERMRWAFERGRKAFEALLWTGKQYGMYYARKPGAPDASPPVPRRAKASANRAGCCCDSGCGETPDGEVVGQVYTGAESHGDLPRPPAVCTREGQYEAHVDDGVMTDAINGNASAAIMGLGRILDPTRVRRFLKLVLARNLQPEALALVNGTYADGHFPEPYPFMQWQTPWSGTEFFFAAQLYAAGLVDDGDRVVDLVFERHVREGVRFDHAECNNHYTRPLSIWAAYSARLGLDYDGLSGTLAVRPPDGKSYRGALVTAAALGWLELGRARMSLELRDGRLRLAGLAVTLPVTSRFTLNGRRLAATYSKGVFRFDPVVELATGDVLRTAGR